MKVVIVISTLFIMLDLPAQDVHWSQYDHNPVFQNPSNVGQFDGDFRFHANYRDQWRSVTVPFQTFSMSAEAKNIWNNRLSVGAYFFHDVVGDGAFTTVEFIPSVAYVFKLSKDSSHTLRPGVQFGFNNRRFNSDAFTFDSQWDGNIINLGLPTNETFATERKTNSTVGVGLGYEFQQGPRNRLLLGVGYFNINRPNHGFLGEDIRRERRFNFFARGEYMVHPKWDIIPSLQFNTQGTYNEFILGMQTKYRMVERPGMYRSFVLGAFLRNEDAFYLLLGSEFQQWWVGVSYDVNFSKLVPASRSRGGLEISLRYILKVYQPRQQIYRVCPDYI